MLDDLPAADWARLKTFRAVAEAKSISAASVSLGVSQAKISRDLESLEHSLGHDLFNRSTKGMELTEIGAVVLKSVRSMADSAQAITTNVSAAGESARTNVTIATHDSLSTYWLAPRLAGFYEAHPTSEVVFKIGFDTPRLTDGEADIAIQYEEPTAPNVFSRPLGWVHYVMFAADSYLSIHGIPEDRFALGRHRVMHHTGYNKQQELWSDTLPSWVTVIPRVLRTNSSTVLVEACANGAGIIGLPTYFATVDQRLRPLLHLGEMAAIRFWLVYTERVRNLKACRPVLDWIWNAFDAEKHPWFREVYEPPNQVT